MIIYGETFYLFLRAEFSIKVLDNGNRPVYFYLFGRNRTGIVQIVLGKVRKFRAA